MEFMDVDEFVSMWDEADWQTIKCSKCGAEWEAHWPDGKPEKMTFVCFTCKWKAGQDGPTVN